MGITFGEALVKPLKIFLWIKYLWSPMAVFAYGVLGAIGTVVFAVASIFHEPTSEFVRPLGWLYPVIVVAVAWQLISLVFWSIENDEPDVWDKREPKPAAEPAGDSTEPTMSARERVVRYAESNNAYRG